MKMNLETWKQKRAAVTSASITRVFIATLFVVNGLLTGYYVFWNVLVNWRGELASFEDRLFAYGLAASIALFVLVLLDGARFGWERASISDGSNLSQQLVSKGMMLASFLASTFVSYLAFNVIYGYYQGRDTGSFGDSENIISLIVTAMLILNIVAAFVYQWLSVSHQVLRANATAKARAITSMIDHLRKSADEATTGMNTDLEEYLPEIVKGMTTDNIALALELLNHRSPGKGKIRELFQPRENSPLFIPAGLAHNSAQNPSGIKSGDTVKLVPHLANDLHIRPDSPVTVKAAVGQNLVLIHPSGSEFVTTIQNVIRIPDDGEDSPN